MWKSIKKFFSDVFKDINGSYSSKRVVTILCVILMVMAYIADLFWNLSVPQFMFEAVSYIVIAGVGFVGAEQFAKGKTGVTGAGSTSPESSETTNTLDELLKNK